MKSLPKIVLLYSKYSIEYITMKNLLNITWITMKYQNLKAFRVLDIDIRY